MRPLAPRSQTPLGNALVPEAPLRLPSAFCLLPSAFCLLLLVCGCNGTQTADSSSPAAAYVKPANRYKVTADSAPFFHQSPQQPAGADEQLKKDARLTFLRRLAGYSQVQTAGGVTGYVDSADVAQISAKEAADEDAARLAAQAPPRLLGPNAGSGFGGFGGGDGGGNGGSYRPPPEAFRDSTLPVPDVGPASPKPTPNPMFRD